MALTRELAAAVAIPLVLAILFLAPPIVFGLLVAAMALATLWEFYRLAERAGHPVSKTVGLVGGLLAIPVSLTAFEREPWLSNTALLMGHGSIAWIALLFVLLTAAVPVLAGVRPAQALGCAAATVMGVLLIPLPAATICLIRITNPIHSRALFGSRAVLFLLGVVWICDSCAYYGGSRWGKHKLAPVVSPKKTWEGSIFGFIGATVFGAAAASWWLLPELGMARGALVGALASSAGQLGDLVESMWKRGAGVKDSGAFLPGHGGFYDRIDSLLFAGPVVAAFIAAL